jgi:hypothetical protein
MMNNYLTALCCDNFGKWYKYRMIRISKTNEFEKFVRSKQIRYINYYDKSTKLFVKRVYL